MSVAVRILDDGAWLSVNDERQVSVSELWRLNAPEFCQCEQTDFLAEGFLSARSSGRTVTVETYGQCIACGSSGTVGHVPVGEIIHGEFYGYDREGDVLTPVA
ncbi:hypothetical protein [Natronocalculus amylovorans]|uniref:DUF8134 domain-containing protein n=1 Tax=Natronocalculus amylovorans TaxID=2917812 RepID=A0AAE3K8A8_9EURY|nr:hypothetical protein [Natronocalculus amylovorans]MCL9816851.1 hypothetical protein [Natronocalculus amylovorans]